jgi:hypothetical protein
MLKKTKFTVGPSKYSKGGRVYLSTYAHGGMIALIVKWDDDYPPEYIATVNMSLSRPLAKNEVWLKGWGENEGVPEALEKAGILKLTGETMPCEYSEAQLGVLSDELINE